jgi:hypothetical protein
VRATFPDAYCARWRLLDHSGDMQYRISNPYRNHNRIIGDVCHTVHDAWASAAAILPNARPHAEARSADSVQADVGPERKNT